jgi:hypothetical protein
MFFLGISVLRSSLWLSFFLFDRLFLSCRSGTKREQPKPKLTRDPRSNRILGSERAGQDSEAGDKRQGEHRMHSRIVSLANGGGCAKCVAGTRNRIGKQKRQKTRKGTKWQRDGETRPAGFRLTGYETTEHPHGVKCTSKTLFLLCLYQVIGLLSIKERIGEVRYEVLGDCWQRGLRLKELRVAWEVEGPKKIGMSHAVLVTKAPFSPRETAFGRSISRQWKAQRSRLPDEEATAKRYLQTTVGRHDRDMGDLEALARTPAPSTPRSIRPDRINAAADWPMVPGRQRRVSAF